MEESRLIETGPLTEYRKGLEYAHRLPGKERISLFYGEAGSGKSEGAREFCRERANCYYVMCPPKRWMQSSTYRLWARMAQAIGIREKCRSSLDYYDAIAAESRRRPMLFCIDNFNRACTYHLVDELKELHDDEQASVRFAFIGTESMLSFFQRRDNDEFGTRAPWKREVRFLTAPEVVEAFPAYKPAAAARLHEITRGRMRHLLAITSKIEAGAVKTSDGIITASKCEPKHLDKLESGYVRMAA